MELRFDARQSQSLSPRLQHAVRLLQMSSLDFGAVVREALGRNPFLEGDEGEEVERVERDTPEERAQGDAGPAPDRTADDEGPGSTRSEAAEQAADDAGDRDLWQSASGGAERGHGDGDLSALDMMAAETALNVHLHGQLNVLPLAPRDLTLARTIVESLDDDGYLRTPLQDLLSVTPLTPPATLPEVQIALRRVQSLEPAGVGARTVSECLLLQMPAIACPDMRALARTIVGEHLHTLAARDVAGLARLLGESPARIEAACGRIRRLDPRPGWQFGTSRVDYVVPDVMVKKVRGEWSVQLNPAVVPKVRLNEVYAHLFQRHRTPQNKELGAHLQEARWTLRNVELRFSTIVDVAAAIVKRQRSFLEYGTMAMKPLGLREIADELGIHESTVSRVTNNKYMATPSGLFELKYFFSRAMVTSSGGACSGTAIRGLVKDIIDAERPESPLSDAEIARQLAGQGLVLARRTVTKYRQMLKLESVERRRRHA